MTEPSTFTAVDLLRLPAPTIGETLNLDTLYGQLQALLPAFGLPATATSGSGFMPGLCGRVDAHGAGVAASNGDSHPADTNGERVAAERAKVKRLDDNTFVEPEMTQASRLAPLQGIPVDRCNGCTQADP